MNPRSGSFVRYGKTCGDKKCVSQRLSEAKRGKPLSPETKQKLRDANLGHKHSQETRQKISATLSKEGSYRWQGGVAAHAGAYIAHQIGPKKYKLEHRIVMEKFIGRALGKDEVVHHWNEKGRDNSLDNLALLRSNSAHMRLHAFARRHGLPVIAFKFDQPWLNYEAQFQPQ